MTAGCKFSWAEMEILRKTWEVLARNNDGTFLIKRAQQNGNTTDYTSQKFELRIPFDDSEIVMLTNNYTPLKVSYNFMFEIPEEFLIYPEDYIDKIGKLFGMREIQIGDSVFDPKFVIKGSSPDFIKKILTFELKNFLLNHYMSNFKMEQSESSSKLEMNLFVKELDAEIMQNVIQTFKDCIMVVKRAGKNN